MTSDTTRLDIAWLDGLVAQGRSSFTTEEARVVHGGTDKAVQGVLRRLRARREIATPLRGLHLILPPEHRRLGCLPPLWFADDLARFLGMPYYVALLSAAELHGAAHQRPQSFQVMLPRPHRALICGGVRMEFVMRTDLEQVPVELRNTPKGTLRLSTPEATAFDLVGYSGHLGGLDTVAAVLGELSEALAADRLAAIIRSFPLPWAQRLGHLLDRVAPGALSEALHAAVQAQEPAWCLLDSAGGAASRRDPRWRVLVNAEVEVEP